MDRNGDGSDGGPVMSFSVLFMGLEVAGGPTVVKGTPAFAVKLSGHPRIQKRRRKDLPPVLLRFGPILQDALDPIHGALVQPVDDLERLHVLDNLIRP